jgi:zinc transport system ATP-binding protein
MAKKAMDIVEIGNLAKQRIGDLSGGQMQRTLMARALVSEPDILILDEPMANLDPNIEHSIYDTLRKVNEEAAILMITHDMGIISSEIKRVACLNRTILVHDEPRITPEMMKMGFHCPMELIAHGVPHRVLEVHPDD